MTHPTPLAAKVAARNNAHAYALKLFPVLAEFWAGYVGQKIENNDGTIAKRIKDKMPAFPETGKTQFELSVYRHTSDYSLAWTVKACECHPGRNSRPGDTYQIANYYEVTVYVGDMRNGVLTAIKDAPTYLRTDYTVEGVEKAREAYKVAKAAADAARSELGDFGEYDVN